MQNDNYGYERNKLVIFVCVTFIFITIFSSATLVSAGRIMPPLFAQNSTNNAIEVNTLEFKGEALAYLGKNNESITYFDKALAISPNDVKALTSKGVALLYTGKINESITYFDKALAISPNDVKALTSKGEALAGLGKYNESITYFDKALAINPKFLVAMKEKEVILGQQLRQQQQNFTAKLSGQNESPPTNTTATGTFVLHLADGRISDYVINLTNINNVASVHIQQGEKGTNGPIVMTLYKSTNPKGQINGTLSEGRIFSKQFEGPLAGKYIFDLIQLINEGKVYINVYTSQNPQGEVRGQLSNATS